MIQTENISKEHYINSISPKYFIQMPFKKNEIVMENDVTCFFCVMTSPMILKCVGIDYFDEIDNEILLNQSYGKYLPSHVYVFKGKPFDLEEERNRLII